MLESGVSNKVNNIGPPFINNCDVTWFNTGNLKSIGSNSNRSHRKRYYPSNFEKEQLFNQSSERVWKRRRDNFNKPTDINLNSKNLRNNNNKMTRTSCQVRRHNDPRYFSGRSDNRVYGYERNRSLSQSNVTTYLPNHQFPSSDISQDPVRNNGVDRRHFNTRLLHQISTHSPNVILQQDKEVLSAPNNNNFCSIQTSQPPSSCGLINQFPAVLNNSVNFRQHPQTNICSQTTRRRHHTSDLFSPYQTGVASSSQYLHSRPISIVTSQTSISPCSIPNRALANNTAFPLINRSFCQNNNQLRFNAYPMNPYSSQQQTMFSRSSVQAPTILSHNSAFCPTVQMPTVIGDVISSTPCHQCAIMAGSGLSTFSNLSSMIQFSVAQTPTSLITLATVSGERIHGSRLSYVPVQTINNWHNHHPYLPAAWSYNDLSSILHNSTARHILQDPLAQRLLSTSPNVGIQFVMMTSSPVLGSNDHSQIRHQLIPVSRTDSLSPIAVSRYLPIIDHFPLIDQPKPGITKQELDQIPIKKFIKLDDENTIREDSKDRCMICLDDFLPNEIIRLLKCSHDFHSTCVERWLKINRTCPLCRADAASLSHHKS